MLEKLILKLTHKMWNRHISRILCRAKADGVINSKQLHEITAAFDPTQKHMVYGANAQRSFLPKLLFCAMIIFAVGCSSPVDSAIASRASELSSGYSKQVAAVSEKQDTAINLLQEHSTALAAIKSQVESLTIETREATDTLKASLVDSRSVRKEDDQQSALEPQEAQRPNPSQPAIPVALPPAVRSSSVVMKWDIEGNKNPSILETAKHLREDHGIIADGMTHQQMHDAHAAAHEGRPVAMKSQTVRIVNQGTYCPNGQCPTSRQSVRVRWRR